jgi:hypothetical protein
MKKRVETTLTVLKKVKKFIVALIAAVTILATALASGEVDATTYIQVGTAFLAALGVYQVRNEE